MTSTGQKGHVVYVAWGWVKVALGGKPVTIDGEVRFYTSTFSEWGPETMVTKVAPDFEPEVDLSNFGSTNEEEPEVDLSGFNPES